MVRLDERLASARRALATLPEVKGLALAPTVARDLRILRFTYSFEAIWKACQLVLAEVHGINHASPKTVVRAARNVGLLSDEDSAGALRMANDRNLAVHLCNEAIARDLALRLDGYETVLTRWLQAMQDLAGPPRG